MNLSHYIVTDPKICHGQPCFKGTRIMVYLVLEMIACGETRDQIVKEAFPRLTKKHIEAALYYAALMAKAGHIVKLPLDTYAVPRG